MKCIACNSDGKMHDTIGGKQFGPACAGHVGFVWGLWFECGDEYLKRIDRWLLRRELANTSGQGFTEAAPKGLGEKACEVAIFEAGLMADAEELS